MTVTGLHRPRTAPSPEPAAAPAGRPRWEYPALALLLVGTAVAYLWNLSASGWGNAFYAAAAQAGSVSWKAFFFGSSDAANSITVDKPPASVWVMALSVRLFGLSSWSVLVPQVLIGVGSVALLWATMRRQFGAAAGLIAGLVLAVTPVAALMFRYDNPDALLVLLMIAAVATLLRAVEDGRTRWLVATGALVGFGFLTKQLQVLLIVPALALTYLLAGPPGLAKRIGQLLAAGASLVVAAGWWVAAVELWPASSRPWIGGSQNNSILELTFGYNGLGRLNGNERGSVGPGMFEQLAEQFPGGELPGGAGMPGGGGPWGSAGIWRMFEPAQGGQIAWLLPAALALLVLGLVLRGRAPRTDAPRAALLVWGGWLLITGLTFSFMQGIFHEYYTVALAPAVAALVGAGVVLGWRVRDRAWVRAALAGTLAATGWMAWVLLDRTPDFVPWLRWLVVVAAVVGVVLLLVPQATAGRAGMVTALVAAFAALAGPVAYAADTIATPHHGGIVSAGPGTGFGPGGGRGPGGMPGMPAGGMPGMPGGTDARGAAERGMGGPAGGLLEGSKPGPAVTAALLADSADYTWVAATVGANSAAGYQLATQLPVMPIGGFNGTDPSPTLAQFQEYVRDGRIHYFIAGGGMGFGGRGVGTSAEITQWVEQTFTAKEVDGVTLYDLTAG